VIRQCQDRLVQLQRSHAPSNAPSSHILCNPTSVDPLTYTLPPNGPPGSSSQKRLQNAAIRIYLCRKRAWCIHCRNISPTSLSIVCWWGVLHTIHLLEQKIQWVLYFRWARAVTDYFCYHKVTLHPESHSTQSGILIMIPAVLLYCSK